jgi:predicted extracellular nuclease
MNKYVALPVSPGRLTVLAGLLASLSAPAMAASPDIVISQVYGAGGNGSGATVATYKHDFIELFNRSGSTVDISNWSVQYASAGGNTWAVTKIGTNIKLEPGQYYLIRQGAGSAAVPDTPADQIGSIPMGGSAGKVALSRTSTPLSGTMPTSDALVDLVGYGTKPGTNGYEGDAPTGSIGNTTSASRAENGCKDTDQNGTDFSIGAVAPRTSTGPRHLCSTGGPVAEPIVPSCPASLAVQQGSGASTLLSASDKDSIVNQAALAAGAPAGITLAGFAPASGAGASASVTLQVDASVAAGSYPVKVNFNNSDSQEASCTVAVSVAGLLKIPQIQGSGAASPYAGTVQSTEGVVTARLGNSLFVQDPVGDGDPTTSDGIYVFNSNAALVSGIVPGDRVRVSGKVTEFRPSGANRTYTELTEVAQVTKLGSGESVAPTNIALPNADLARYEGMLVRFVSDLTVNQNKYLGDRGELTLAQGRRESPTNRHLAGSPEASRLAAENAANEIVLDDGLFSAPPVIPYLGEDNTVRAGDTVTNLTGVLDYGAIGGGGAAFKLQPTEAPRFSRTNPRQPAPSLPAGVKVASANVLNFFTTFTDGTDAWGRSNQGCTIGSRTSASECRGADNITEFVRQRNQIVASLKALDADVIGLMEIQNNGDVATAYLVDQLNATIGQQVYALVPTPSGVSPGTDAIRVAMIYKPAVVTPVGSALLDSDRVNNRAPMAQTFKATNGAKFSVVVNHFKSKASCGGATGGNVELGNGQGCWDQTRVDQATRLTDVFLPQVKTAAGDDDVLVIGDLNAYQGERPIQHLVARGFVNQIERFVRPLGTPYSYVFDGASGYLDHALASSTLSPQVAGAAEWHNNADEPEHIDYNLGDTAQDPYRENAYRASDHDPVVVSLALTPTFSDVTAAVKIARSGLTLSRATGKYSGTVTITNTGGQTLNGPLHLRLDGLSTGVTLDNRTGMQGSAPYITLPNTSLAAGASVTVSTVFTNPQKLVINYTSAFVSGTF